MSSCSLGDVDEFLENEKTARVFDRLLLAWAQGRYELTDLLGVKKPSAAGKLAESSFGQARSVNNIGQLRKSADFLGYVGAPGAQKSLALEQKDRRTWTRLHVLIASARLGNADAANAVLREMDNAPAAWLPGIVRLLERVREPAVRKTLQSKLEDRTKSKDSDMAMAAAAVLLAWDPDPGFFRFLDALASKSPEKQELARRYLLRAREKKVTWVMRRALARESRPFVKDELRVLLDDRS
jgi:hypothetical protein